MAITVREWNDATTWNSYVANTPRAHFQQSWEWGDLAPQLAGEPVRLAAVRDGELCGAMQIFVHPIHHTGRTYLSVPRGPAVACPTLDVLGPLNDAAEAVGRDRHAVGLRIEPNVLACSADWKTALRGLGYRPMFPPSQPRSSWVLDISREPESLLEQMKQKTRYNIRLAARKGVEIEEGGPDHLDAFYHLYGETAARDGFFIQPKSVYERMFSLFWKAGNFALLQARYQGKLLAAVTLVTFGSTCWYLHGASSNEYRNLMATYLLQWRGIEWAKSRGCSLYDFRAVPDRLQEDQDMYGVYRFKEGFGGHQFTTLHTHAIPYQRTMFGLWQLYFSGRFALDAWRRRRKGLPARQFA